MDSEGYRETVPEYLERHQGFRPCAAAAAGRTTSKDIRGEWGICRQVVRSTRMEFFCKVKQNDFKVL